MGLVVSYDYLTLNPPLLTLSIKVSNGAPSNHNALGRKHAGPSGGDTGDLSTASRPAPPMPGEEDGGELENPSGISNPRKV